MLIFVGTTGLGAGLPGGDGVILDWCHPRHLDYVAARNPDLKIVAARMQQLSQRDAEGFYAVHRERGFFNDLVKFMVSGPVMISVLEGEGAILKHRELMGATDPKKAAPGTIRADFAESIDANAVHGSDAPETAAVEIAYFFRSSELCPR